MMCCQRTAAGCGKGLFDAATARPDAGNYFAGRWLDARSSSTIVLTAWSRYRYFGSLGRRSLFSFQSSRLRARCLPNLLRRASLPTLKISESRSWVYHACSSSTSFEGMLDEEAARRPASPEPLLRFETFGHFSPHR